MWNELKRVFRRPSLLEAAAEELANAEHSKLEAESAAEYADALVIYHDKRIVRLKNFIQSLGDKSNDLHGSTNQKLA